MHRSIALVPFIALALAPSAASAHPRIATDGLYIGVRLEPGGALAALYDLDIYLTGDRFVSLGPAVSFSVLGEDGADQGRRQDYLFAVDVLRVKVSLTGPGGDWIRPFVFLGGGFYYAQLPAQRSEPRDVLVLPDETPASAVIVFPERSDWGGLASGGAGADLYLVDSFALSVLYVIHVRISDQERVPLVWSELLLGVRFGL